MSSICIPHPHQSLPKRSDLINFQLQLDSGNPLHHILRSFYMIGTSSWTTPIPVQYKHWNRTKSYQCSYHFLSEPHHPSRSACSHAKQSPLAQQARSHRYSGGACISSNNCRPISPTLSHTKLEFDLCRCRIWALHPTLSHELSRNDPHSLRYNPNSSCQWILLTHNKNRQCTRFLLPEQQGNFMATRHLSTPISPRKPPFAEDITQTLLAASRTALENFSLPLTYWVGSIPYGALE